MSTPTFYIRPDRVHGQTAALSGEELHHAVSVLRSKAGDAVVLVDGLGTRYAGRFCELSNREGVVAIEETTVEPEPSLRLTLGMGIVSGERFEWAVQKTTELGVTGIVPLITERSEGKVATPWKRLPRLTRIAVAACKQCGRARFPILYEPVPVATIDPRTYDACVVFWEDTPGISFRDVLSRMPQPSSCLAVIGPVGGLTQHETADLADRGAVIAGLGPRILRTETAAMAAVTLLQHAWGDMG